MNLTHLKVKKEGNLLWLTLDLPDKRNAISLPMVDSLTTILKDADWDSKVKVIILTGAGSAFCAGGDIKAMKDKSGMFAGDSETLRQNYMKGIQQIPRAIEALQTPIIAMVNGPAIGAGLDLACMCDLRVASTKASFGETFAKVGLVPGDGGTFFLPRVVGYAKAMEMSLTAKVYSAEEAQKMGLVNFLTDELKSYTKELAETIAKNSFTALTMIKKGLKGSRDLNTQLDLMAAFQGITQRTQDHFDRLK
ncbi:MAG: 3-hxdroxyacyl-CoA dehydrogenase [Epsilonproteobacteria bacterium]|nr:MAG: 3-hxdroxyacyl-CoA dehydrogenase [Campylobacterota bacterium]RLA64614.1 MAG: 3-hxdroxyacyl-CoA dehydrogenase [Campylobacterota bacterium]